MIPELTKRCIDEYVELGVPPGDFVRAVLENNLLGAFGTADSYNTYFMRDIVAYVYNCIPSGCHGSREIVNQWLRMHKEFAEIRDSRKNEKI